MFNCRCLLSLRAVDVNFPTGYGPKVYRRKILSLLSITSSYRERERAVGKSFLYSSFFNELQVALVIYLQISHLLILVNPYVYKCIIPKLRARSWQGCTLQVTLDLNSQKLVYFKLETMLSLYLLGIESILGQYIHV